VSSYAKRAREIGLTAELLASLCFEACPERAPVWFKSLRRATSEEDAKGIDLVVEIDLGQVLIQVKSSWSRAKEFVEKHPEIPVLVVHPEDSEDRVRRNLLRIVRYERAKLDPNYDPTKDGLRPPVPKTKQPLLGATVRDRVRR
jgi:hypothetical protein